MSASDAAEKEAAHRPSLSHSTVKYHLANARSKAGATTTAQLVRILVPRPPGRPRRGLQPSAQRDTMAQSAEQESAAATTLTA